MKTSIGWMVVALFTALGLGCTSSSNPFYGEEVGESADTKSLTGEPSGVEEASSGTKPTGSESTPVVEGPTGNDEADCEDAPYGFGCACEGNADCETGWCVAGLNGNVCTKPCLENCPDGWKCKSIDNLGGDLIYVCVPVVPELCLACTANDECGADVDRCVQMGEVSVCGAGCEADTDCPDGYGCLEGTDVAGETSLQCMSTSGSCECTPDVNGMTVACTVENEAGKCFGEKTCQGADGWSECNAQTPSEEVCDGIDNDCDLVFDEGLVGEPCETSNDLGTCEGVTVCNGELGVACGAPEPVFELCDGLDNDCNGEVDEGSPENCLTFYLDADGDGYGDTEKSQCVCAPEGEYDTLESGDCDDSLASVFPGAAESCNGIDDDCDTAVDEDEGAIGCTLYFQDADQDGFGDALIYECLCQPSDAFPVEQIGDCDDSNPEISIGELESCNGIDDNCNGFIDEGCDLDEDGYCDGDLTEGNDACPNGGGDCNDNAPNINPGAIEVCNTIDDNCDDQVDEGVQSPCGGCTPLCVSTIGEEGDGFQEEGLDGMIPNEDGHLELATDSFTFNMLWVANSGDGTISRVDTETNQEVGRYSICNDPSRTAVDLVGNAWIACRGDGNVAKVLIDPLDCPDKNGNGVIETSMDANGDGQISGAEMVADDECVLFNKKPANDVSKARAMGVDAENHAWVGFWNTKKLIRVDPDTGDGVQTINLPNSPYGLAIDADGIIWVAGRSDGQHLVRVDPSTGDTQQFKPTFDCFEPYGIAVSQAGDVWIGNCCCGHYAWRFEPGPVENGVVVSGTWSNVTTNARPRGIVADTSGFVYVANDQDGEISKIDVDSMTVVDTAQLGSPSFPVGITIDSQGFVWAVNQQGNSATKVDPDTMDVVATVPVGNGPYTYSDMTGYALKTVTAPEGFYRHIFTGWENGPTQWAQIAALTLKPEGTKIEVRYRAANSLPELAATPWSEVFGPFPPAEMPINLLSEPDSVAKHIEVEVKLYSAEGGATPVLTKLEVIAVTGE